MKKVMALLFLLLFIVHHDFWFWNEGWLLFGFLPIGLAYHALFSILCSVVWALAIKFAWPDHLKE